MAGVCMSQCDSEGGRRALSNGPPSPVMDGSKAAPGTRACDLADGIVRHRSILLTWRPARTEGRVGGQTDQPGTLTSLRPSPGVKDA
ncbi:unnamed protein product [Arctogadus glacialis]